MPLEVAKGSLGQGLSLVNGEGNALFKKPLEEGNEVMGVTMILFKLRFPVMEGGVAFQAVGVIGAKGKGWDL